MKKSFLLIAILLLMFFINKVVVNASIDVNLCDQNGVCAGNNNTSNWVFPMRVSDSSFNYTVNGSTNNPDDGLSQGQRWRVIATYCVVGTDGQWNFDYRTSVGVSINQAYVSLSPEATCQHTDSNGLVRIGTPIRLITDFNINTNGVFYLRYYISRYLGGELQSNWTSFGFNQYYILDQGQLTDNENTQNIINNNNSNTQDIVNAQNGTTNAVNGLNNSVNNTDTSGSENFLTSIINDPAFQDNTGINGIIQLPLAMISSLSSQCSAIDIYIPFLNVNTQLPCISSIINQKMPAVANILRIAVNGFVLYRIFIDIVGLIKSARNPDEDRLDVLEL